MRGKRGGCAMLQKIMYSRKCRGGYIVCSDMYLERSVGVWGRSWSRGGGGGDDEVICITCSLLVFTTWSY